jgi:hypothetical protein
MDQYELGVAMAAAHLAELRRNADRWRLARRIPRPDRRSAQEPHARMAMGPRPP